MLKELITELGVKDQVQITGWADSNNVLANIKKADVCCVPHHSNPHTDNTIPHKLFQYMIAKRPILVSSSLHCPFGTIRQAMQVWYFQLVTLMIDAHLKNNSTFGRY